MSYGNCEKKHRTVASFTTNVNDPATSSWDLTPYKTAGIGTVRWNMAFDRSRIQLIVQQRQDLCRWNFGLK